MKLFGHPDSAHALKVKFYLEYLGIDYDYECIDIFAPPNSRPADFLSASGFAEVPTLIDEGNTLTQSNAILMYLADKYQPFNNTSDRQACLEWLMWEANKIGMCLPQIRCHEHLSTQNPKFTLTQGAYDWLLARYTHDVGVLEKELSHKAFILGNIVSPADFSLCAYLMYADDVSIDVPQHVQNWLGRMRALHGWQNPYEMLQ